MLPPRELICPSPSCLLIFESVSERTNLTDSATTTSSGASANTSVITVMMENFQNRYAEIDSKKLPLHELVSQAECLIDKLGLEQGKDEIEYKGEKLQAHDVLRAMLEHAEGCGGEHGKRYTVTAICACIQDKQWDGEETLDALHDLASTWVSHFLFVFKCSSYYNLQQLNKTPSEIATLTFDDNKCSVYDRGNLRNLQVLKRDGYQCVLSDMLDWYHPKYKHSTQLGVPRYYLQACCILRCAAATFKPNQDHQSYLSALATFNIFHNYTNLPEGIMSNLEGVIDHPSNAFLLGTNQHNGFDEFEWCLMATETPNVFTVKKYSDFSGLGPNENKQTIEFKNHNQELAPGVDFPNPHFIAIHAAIGGILHMSGADRFFERLLGKFGDSESPSFPVCCWEEFEQMVQLIEAEQLVQDVAKIHI